MVNNRRCKCGYEVHFLGREVYTERKNCRKAGAGYEKTVITIARSYGSGGKTLGNLLAKDLGINCYSREILRMASDESGINEALFGEVDEKMKKSPLLFNILKRIHIKVEYFRRKAVILYQMTIFSIIRQRLSRILPHRSHALSLAAVQIMF